MGGGRQGGNRLQRNGRCLQVASDSEEALQKLPMLPTLDELLIKAGLSRPRDNTEYTSQYGEVKRMSINANCGGGGVILAPPPSPRAATLSAATGTASGPSAGPGQTWDT